MPGGRAPATRPVACRAAASGPVRAVGPRTGAEDPTALMEAAGRRAECAAARTAEDRNRRWAGRPAAAARAARRGPREAPPYPAATARREPPRPGAVRRDAGRWRGAAPRAARPPRHRSRFPAAPPAAAAAQPFPAAPALPPQVPTRPAHPSPAASAHAGREPARWEPHPAPAPRPCRRRAGARPPTSFGSAASQLRHRRAP